MKKAVIIGSGVGGLAIANYLAQNGYAVEVYEKNANPGGRCGQIIQEGHRFDLGATILLMPSLYRKVLSELGIDLEKDLETTSLEPVYKLFFGDGTDFSFTRDPEKMKAQLEAIEPGSFQKFNEYVTEGYQFFNLSMNDLLGRIHIRHRLFSRCCPEPKLRKVPCFPKAACTALLRSYWAQQPTLAFSSGIKVRLKKL